MKNLGWVSIFLIFFWGCENAQQGQLKEAPGEATGAKDEVSFVEVEEFLKNPENYSGKEIALKGTVVHVCKHGGKRLHMIGENPDLQLKVESGENQNFQRELEGSNVMIKGVVIEETIDEAHLEKRMEEVDGHAEDAEHQQEQRENMEKMRQKLQESSTGKVTRYTVQCKNFQVL